MNARITVLEHYVDLESQARDAAKARETIEQLRAALHDAIEDIKAFTVSFRRENDEWQFLIARAQNTLVATLPGADLDGMPKADRALALRDALIGIVRP